MLFVTQGPSFSFCKVDQSADGGIQEEERRQCRSKLYVCMDSMWAMTQIKSMSALNHVTVQVISCKDKRRHGNSGSVLDRNPFLILPSGARQHDNYNQEFC